MLPTHQVHYIDNQTLDAFVTEHYGIEYKTQRHGNYGEPCHQETVITFTVDPENDSSELWWDEDETGNYAAGPPRIFLSWKGEGPTPEWAHHCDGMPHAGTIIYDLALQGLAPTGPYAVRVWW